MPKIKHLSGKEVVKILESLGFVTARQKESHIILKRIISEETQVILVPNHSTIDRGTLSVIYKKLISYTGEAEIKRYFYTE